MDILYLLVPMSVLLALFILVLFAWALKNGQFEGIEPEGRRILDDDQGAASTVSEESSSPSEDSHGSNENNKRSGSGRL